MSEFLKTHKNIVGELFGSFVLTFCGCGAYCVGAGILGISLAFALVYYTLIQIIEKDNKEIVHLNPSISFVYLLMGKIDIKTFLFYFAAQIVGCLLGAFAVIGFIYMSVESSLNMFPYNTAANNIIYYADTGKYRAGNTFGGILTEFVLTFLFVYIYLVANNIEDKHNKGILIGSGVAMVHLVGIRITGCSLNFARSLATAITEPAFFDSHRSIEQIWIWILAPILGALAARFWYKLFNEDKGPQPVLNN